MTEKQVAAQIGARIRKARAVQSMTLAALAKRRKVDKIIMGTHGRGTLAGMLMGSVASKVLHRAAVPVTLVK